MPDYNYRDNLSPDAIVYAPNSALPTSNTDLFLQKTFVGSINKIGAIEIYFCSTVGGVLKLVRTTANSVTTNETLNFGNPVTANVPVGPQVVTVSGGETIGVIYSGTGGTFYLTVADVSGDIVQKSRS